MPFFNHNRAISFWLLVCCAMIFAMAVIGAITRLTESGLSIVEWAPVTGAIPPLSESDWQKAFTAYQAIPQYQILNRGMALEDFKTIYFWEWLHRLWGRLIGLVFALPFCYFLLRRQLDKPLALKLFGLLCLGGLQGFVGWFMVQSGLEDRTHVSPYRLAMHLGLALVIYSLTLWLAMEVGRGSSVLCTPNGDRRIKEGANFLPHIPRTNHAGGLLLINLPAYFGWLCLGLLALTILWGALVAGHRAGYAYNTWPLMDGAFLPEESWTLQPLWQNFFANTALVQFVHRWLAALTGLAIFSWIAMLWRGADQPQRRWLAALGGMVLLQIALGVATLLTQVNIVLATLHQAGAITLLTLLLVNLHRVGWVRYQPAFNKA